MKLAAGLGLAIALAAPAAFASPVTHADVLDFSSIVLNQGLTGDGVTPVQASRSDIANAFDTDLTTMYSLGIGGSAAFIIDPVANVITSGSVIELTNLGSGHLESAVLSLGVNGGGWVDIGELFNSQLGGTATQIADATIAAISASTTGGSTTYTLTVGSGVFNSIMLADTSAGKNAATSAYDGFDITELRVTSDSATPVPEPAALALFGAGLLGLGLVRRRKA